MDIVFKDNGEYGLLNLEREDNHGNTFIVSEFGTAYGEIKIGLWKKPAYIFKKDIPELIKALQLIEKSSQ